MHTGGHLENDYSLPHEIAKRYKSLSILSYLIASMAFAKTLLNRLLSVTTGGFCTVAFSLLNNHSTDSNVNITKEKTWLEVIVTRTLSVRRETMKSIGVAHHDLTLEDLCDQLRRSI